MRVKPPPGTYIFECEGQETTVIITTNGMTCTVGWWVFEVTMEWEWFEMSHGPALMPSGGPAVQYIGFNADGTCDMVFPDGTGKTGRYRHV